MVPGRSTDSAQKTIQNRLFKKKHDDIKELSIHDQNPIRLPRQEQDGKPEPPVISALFKSGPS